MKRKQWMRGLGVFAGLALIAGGCGGRDDDDDADTGSAPEETGGEGGEIATGPGFDGETITLGIITDNSGPAALIGGPLTAGNVAYFEQLNADGGVAGQFQVDVSNVQTSGFDQAAAAQEYAASKDSVAMYVQILGTQIVTSLLGGLATDQIVASPASLDSLWVREPNLIPIGAPYQIQAINGLSYHLEEGGGSTDDVLCVLRASDLFGEAGLEGVEFASEELDWPIATVVEFPVNQSATAGAAAFSTQIGQLQSANCEVVWLTALPGDAAASWGVSAAAQFAPQWLANSPAWLETIYSGSGPAAPVAPYVNANVLIVAEGPAYGDEAVEGMADLVAAQEAAGVEPDIYFNFGYAQAAAVHQVLEEAVRLGDLSRAGILAAVESVETLSFGGLLGDYTYGPVAERNPPRVNSIFRANVDAPTGLELVQGEVASDAAAAFEFGD